MEVIVYSKPRCPSCDSTKRMMDRNNIRYTEIDITQNPDALERIKSLGYLQVPVVEAGDDHWSNFRYDRIKGLASLVAS